MTTELYALVLDVNKPIEEFINDVYDIIKTNDKIRLRFSKYSKVQASFNPTTKSINMNLDFIRKNLIDDGRMVPAMYRKYLNEEDKLIEKYFERLHIINVLLHENTHVKQDLIVKHKMDTEYPFDDMVYRETFRCFDNPILHLYYVFVKNEEIYFERDACIAATKECLKIAQMLKIEKIIKLYQDYLDYYLLLGYTKEYSRSNLFVDLSDNSTLNIDGPIKSTYKLLLANRLYETINIPCYLPSEKRFELGFDLREDELSYIVNEMYENNPNNHLVRYRTNHTR